MSGTELEHTPEPDNMHGPSSAAAHLLGLSMEAPLNIDVTPRRRIGFREDPVEAMPPKEIADDTPQ